MATRLYLPESLAAPVTPVAPTADWGHINSLQRALLITPDGSALTTTAYTPDAADHLTNTTAHHRQYVSDPLEAQTLSGNFTAQIQALEAHANNQLFLTIKILLCDQTGATTRATVLAITRATSLEFGTTIANRTFPSTALTSTVVTPGDRLVVEIGVGGNVTTAASQVQGHNGSLRFGCSAAGGDLPVDETATGTTLRPWIEFANNLIWHAPGAVMAPQLAGFRP